MSEVALADNIRLGQLVLSVLQCSVKKQSFTSISLLGLDILFRVNDNGIVLHCILH